MPYKDKEVRNQKLREKISQQKAAGTFDYVGARARTKKWRDSHREHKRAYKKAHYWKNRDKILAHLRAKRPPGYYKKREASRKIRMQENPDLKRQRVESNRKTYEKRREKAIEVVKKYIAANPEKVREYKRTTSARRRLAKGRHSTTQWLARFEFYARKCAYCGTDLTIKTPHRDHVIPVSLGGSNWPSNLAPACKTCNLRKGIKRWKPKMPKPDTDYFVKATAQENSTIASPRITPSIAP